MVASLAGVESVVRAPRFTMTQREQTLSGSAIARGCNMTKSKPKAKRVSTSESMPKPKPKSKPKPKPVTVARLKRAIEGRNAHALAALYGEDAVVQVIDRDNPPSKPRNLEGRSAISAYFDDVYGRDMNSQDRKRRRRRQASRLHAKLCVSRWNQGVLLGDDRA